MSAISDTSPLNYLARLGYSDVLEEIYGTVLVPEAVLVELTQPGSPTEVRAWIENTPSWLKIINIDKTDPTLPPDLGPGEREAISLAQHSPGSILLLHDRDARGAAIDRNIEIAGTMTVLSEAGLRRRLDFRQTVTRLKLAGFRISAEHESAVLDRHQEKLKRMQTS